MKRGGPLKRTEGLAKGKGLKPVSKGRAQAQTQLAAHHKGTLARANNRCERCASCYGVQAHHVVSRGRARNHPLLHDLRNGAALCSECHRMVHGAGFMADRDKWLKPARALDEMEPGERLARVDPATAFAISDLYLDPNQESKMKNQTETETAKEFDEQDACKRFLCIIEATPFSDQEQLHRRLASTIRAGLDCARGTAQLSEKQLDVVLEFLTRHEATASQPGALPRLAAAMADAITRGERRPCIRLAFDGARFDIAYRPTGQYGGQVVICEVTERWHTVGTIQIADGVLDIFRWVKDHKRTVAAAAHAEADLQAAASEYNRATGRCSFCNRDTHETCATCYGLSFPEAGK